MNTKGRQRLRITLAVLCLTLVVGAQNPEALAKARQSYELARSGNLEQAASVMREAIRLEPANPLYHSALGGILAKQGKAAESRSSFEEAVRLDPGNPLLRLQLAARQWETGLLESARANLLQVLEKQPSNTAALDMLENISLEWGAILAREKRYRAGRTLARDTARRFPKSARVHEMLGLFETRTQENILAAAAYRRALELDPNSPGASVGLAIAQSAAGMQDDAVATFEAGINRFPQDAMHYQAYGVLLVKMGDTREGYRERGAALLEQALKLNPKLSEANYQLGNLALARGDAEEAIRRFLQAVSNGEDSSRVHFAMSRAYRRLGRMQESEAAMARFRERKAAEERSQP